MKINNKILLLSIILWPVSTLALESDYEKLISVSSVSQHAKMKSNTTIFSEDVLLTQGTIKITGDKLTVIRGELPNHEIMIADGKVATFYQMQDDGKPFEAEAEQIHYDVAKSQITLSGNAQIKQLDSQINGSKITYFLETEELLVESQKGSAQRVKTVFLPAQFEKNNESQETIPTQQTEDK
jgi:lipopolysaccharide export system protein LptA